MFEKNKIKLDEEKQAQIKILQEKYEKEKQEIINRIINSIILK